MSTFTVDDAGTAADQWSAIDLSTAGLSATINVSVAGAFAFEDLGGLGTFLAADKDLTIHCTNSPTLSGTMSGSTRTDGVVLVVSGDCTIGATTIHTQPGAVPLSVSGDDVAFSGALTCVAASASYAPPLSVLSRTAALALPTITATNFAAPYIHQDTLDYSQQAAPVLSGVPAGWAVFSVREFGPFERAVTLAGSGQGHAVASSELRYKGDGAQAWCFQVVARQPEDLAQAPAGTAGMAFDVTAIDKAQFPAAADADVILNHTARFGPTNQKPGSAVAGRSMEWKSHESGIVREFNVTFESSAKVLGRLAYSVECQHTKKDSSSVTYKFPVQVTTAGLTAANGALVVDTTTDNAATWALHSTGAPLTVTEADVGTTRVRARSALDLAHPLDVVYAVTTGSKIPSTLSQYPEDGSGSVTAGAAAEHAMDYPGNDSAQHLGTVAFERSVTASWPLRTAEYGKYTFSSAFAFSLVDDDFADWKPRFRPLHAQGTLVGSSGAAAGGSVFGFVQGTQQYESDNARGYALAPAANATTGALTWRHKATTLTAEEPTVAFLWQPANGFGTPVAHGKLHCRFDIFTAGLAARGWAIDEAAVADWTLNAQPTAAYGLAATAAIDRATLIASSGAKSTTTVGGDAVTRVAFDWPTTRALNEPVLLWCRLAPVDALAVSVSVGTADVDVCAYVHDSDAPSSYGGSNNDDAALIISADNMRTAMLGATSAANGRFLRASFTPQNSLLLCRYNSASAAANTPTYLYTVLGDRVGTSSHTSITALGGSPDHLLQVSAGAGDHMDLQVQLIGRPTQDTVVNSFVYGADQYRNAQDLNEEGNRWFTAKVSDSGDTGAFTTTDKTYTTLAGSATEPRVFRFSTVTLAAPRDDKGFVLGAWVASPHADDGTVNGVSTWTAATTAAQVPSVASYMGRAVTVDTDNSASLAPQQYPAPTVPISSANVGAKVRVQLNTAVGGTGAVEYDWVVRYYAENADKTLTRVTDGVDGLVTVAANNTTTPHTTSRFTDGNDDTAINTYAGDHTKSILFADQAWPAEVARVKIFLKGRDLGANDSSFWNDYDQEAEWLANGLVAQYQVNITSSVGTVATAGGGAVTVDSLYLAENFRLVVVGTRLEIQQSINGAWQTTQWLDLTQATAWQAGTPVAAADLFTSPSQGVFGNNGVFAPTTAASYWNYDVTSLARSDAASTLYVEVTTATPSGFNISTTPPAIGDKVVVPLADGDAAIGTVAWFDAGAGGVNTALNMATTDSDAFYGDESFNGGTWSGSAWDGSQTLAGSGKLYRVTATETATATATTLYPVGGLGDTNHFAGTTSAKTYDVQKAAVVKVWVENVSGALTLTDGNGVEHALTLDATSGARSRYATTAPVAVGTATLSGIADQVLATGPAGDAALWEFVV
jgi:hypothetical protein